MKKIFSALFFTLFGAAALMTSCSDVPAPYEIKSPDDVDLVGTGTKEDPYNVATAQMKQDGSVAWVQGYIVGVMETNVDPFTANFAAPFSTSSNLMIADTPDEQKAKNCVIVQLPFGAIRTALNLVDHADNLKQPVILQGTLTSYFSAAGLKEVSAGVFKGEEIGEEEGGEGETPEGNLIFEEKFTANEGDFTIKNVTLPEGSSYVWKWEQYQTNPPYMKASAYVGGSNKASESWLISPAINLSDATKATLVFKHAHKFGVDKTKELTLWATEAGKEAWEQLTIPNYSSGESWTMVSSGNIDLSKYAGKEVQVGFKYVSTTEGAPTWEVNDVQVYSDGSGNVPTPEEEVTVTKDAPYVESFESGLGKFIIDNKEIGSLSFVWKHDTSYKCMKASAYVNGTNNVTESWLTSPIIDLTGVDKAVLTFQQAINYANGKASQYFSVVATEAGMNNWEPLTITYPESDGWDFVASGDVDLNKYAGKKVQLAFKYTSSSETAATWEVKNVKVAAAENGGGTEPEPGTGDNLLANSSFETWTGETPDSWGRASVTSATYAQNADAQDGTYSVLMKGSSSNARFGSEDITLSAGTYTLSVYAKSVADPAKFRMGWVPIEGGNPNTSKYNYILDSTDLSNEWQEYSAEFTLDAETVVSIFFVNSKSGSGKDLLIDKVSLIKK
ncbi:DUF6359 domain-containing protein [Phocaeicola sp.]|uniref:DUF6359 domain-containing protein n=1 Tax=Phocaeicola sp. TaxID=2773926 RepID=UPI00386962EE